MKSKKGKISLVVAMLLVVITGLLIMWIFGEQIKKVFATVTDPLLKKIGLEEEDSGQQPLAPLPPCLAPTGLSCTYNALSNTIKLQWNSVPGAINYKMQWAKSDKSYGDATDTTGGTDRTTSSTSGNTYGLRTRTQYKLHTRVERGSTCTAPSLWSSDVSCETIVR